MSLIGWQAIAIIVVLGSMYFPDFWIHVWLALPGALLHSFLNLVFGTLALVVFIGPWYWALKQPDRDKR